MTEELKDLVSLREASGLVLGKQQLAVVAYVEDASGSANQLDVGCGEVISNPGLQTGGAG